MSKLRTLIAGLVAVACLPAAVAVAAPANGTAGGNGNGNAAAIRQRNPLGVVIVNFKKGTSKATMTSVITAAGGTVTSDLSKLGRMAAVSTSAGFASKLQADKRVVAVFSDKVWQAAPPDAESGETGNNDPALGNGPIGATDPWHDLPSFLGETNPEGILQWDDNRMNVPEARAAGATGAGVRVAVLDTGVQGSHKEILPNYDNQTSANTIPCSSLVKTYGAATVNAFGLRDCSSEDKDGHGTWVASRIAGALNGFASNGVAPAATVSGYKVLSVDFGGLTSWIVDGMVRACDADVDVINMSLGGFNDPFDLTNEFAVYDALDTMLWVEAVNYCRGKGTAILASAGNNHVRINRTNAVIDFDAYPELAGEVIPDLVLTGVGRVDSGPDGVASVIPGTPAIGKYSEDLRGMIETPAGIPGVIMVSATNNAVPDAEALAWSWEVKQPVAVGARDQLTYYSNYGSRVDITAPGGARKYNVPRYDIGNADILYGGWGTLGGTDPSGDLCASAGGLTTFACFKANGAGFAWLQGTSMSSPNATGVAALTIAAHPELAENPDALLAHLQSTARTDMVNYMVPNDPTDTSESVTAGPCTTGWCHLDYDAPAISFSDAYGAGMVDAGAAVTTAP